MKLVASTLALALAAGLAWGQNQPAKPEKHEPTPAKKVEKPADAKKDEKAPEATLKVGMKAPTIKVDTWVKGSEVKSFDKGHVYVVEFWATWCGPCKASIPHLTDFQKKNKDHVTLISVAASERKPKEGESDNRLPNLQKFVADQGDKMGYTIAYDGDREMSNDWMKAAGQQFIPTAFVVDGEGKLAWVGTVGDDKGKKGMEEAVEKAVKAIDKATNPKKNENKGG